MSASFQKQLVAFLIYLALQSLAAAPDGECSWNANKNEKPCVWASAYSHPVKQQKIIDITRSISPSSTVWESADGLGGGFRSTIRLEFDEGPAFVSEFKVSAHQGTHLDAPSHFVEEAYQSGTGVESLSLETLNGPALVVSVPPGSNITDQVMKDLAIPPGIDRLLFRTENSDKKLMQQTAFDPTYIGVTPSGATWIAENTNIRLIGIDYLSVAAFATPHTSHYPLLSKGVILVEGLVLEDVTPGLYMLHCLPLKLEGSDGAPTRCILIE